jgi:hypothetical protein
MLSLTTCIAILSAFSALIVNAYKKFDFTCPKGQTVDAISSSPTYVQSQPLTGVQFHCSGGSSSPIYGTLNIKSNGPKVNGGIKMMSVWKDKYVRGISYRYEADSKYYGKPSQYFGDKKGKIVNYSGCIIGFKGNAGTLVDSLEPKIDCSSILFNNI